MKDTHSWMSMLLAAAYMIFKIISAVDKRKIKPIDNPDWEEETEQEEISWPFDKDITNLSTTKDTIHKMPELTKNDINNAINTPSYPGVKKLLLPTQEQNPYKLYKSTSPSPTNRLNQLLSRYNNSQRAIIMAELLQKKTSI